MYRYHDTQVFRSDELKRVAKGIRDSVTRGGPASAFSMLDVLPNERFGVTPYRVGVHWVFLDAHAGETAPDATDPARSASRNWLAKIPSKSPAYQLLESRAPGLERFPNYRTFSENRGFSPWYMIKLKEEQTTLLAHYTAWSVASRRAELLEFLSSAKCRHDSRNTQASLP